MVIYGDFSQQHKILIITNYWPLVHIKVQQLIVIQKKKKPVQPVFCLLSRIIYLCEYQTFKKSKNIFQLKNWIEMPDRDWIIE